MKKVLALVLAVMMLSTMAFAVTKENVVEDANNVKFGGRYAPGDTLYVYKDMWDDAPNEVTDWSFVTDQDEWNAEINDKNYIVTSQKWPVGKELLAGLEFDNKNDQLKIKLKEDYTLKQPKQLKGSFTLKGKGKGGVSDSGPDGRTEAERPNTIKVEIDITIGNWKQKVNIDPDKDITLGWNDPKLHLGDDAASFKTAQTLLVSPDGDEDPSKGEVGTDLIWDNAVQKFAGKAYGNVVINCADEGDTEVTFRAYKNDEFFLFNDTDADNDLLKAYADENAEISFLNFPSKQVLNSNATIRFYKDENSHVYVMKDGKLTSEVKWDDDEDCFILKTRTLGSYVFSDKALPFNVAAPGNPDTGANDVVGIATALAAVALVSAAAVSLKK